MILLYIADQPETSSFNPPVREPLLSRNEWSKTYRSGGSQKSRCTYCIRLSSEKQASDLIPAPDVTDLEIVQDGGKLGFSTFFN